MANSGGKITAPVNMRADVRTVLGESVNTLSGLCTSTKINPWAKYKPVKYASNAPDRSSSGTWWRANDGLCGFTIPLYATASDATTNAVNDAWNYAPPTGGTYPYRLYDFADYVHNAVVPLTVQIPSKAVYTNGHCNGVIKFVIVTQISGGLNITDVFNGTYYWGVAVGGYAITSSTTIASGGTSLSLDGCPAITGTGTKMVVAFITTSKQTSWGTFEHSCYNLQAVNMDNPAAQYCQIVSTVADGYAIGFSGLDPADKTAWIKSGNAAMTSGRFTCSGTVKKKYTRSYTLVSVTASAVRNSDGYTVTRTVTAANLTYVNPGDIDKNDYVVNDTIVFGCNNINPTSLPKEAGDYYTITYIFNYS